MNNDLKNFLSAKIAKLKLTTNDIPDLFKLATKKFPDSVENIWEIIANCFYEQEEYNNCLVTLELYAQELNLTTQELGAIVLERYASGQESIPWTQKVKNSYLILMLHTPFVLE